MSDLPYEPRVETVYPQMRTPRLAVFVDDVSIADLVGLLGRVSATWGALASTICVPRERALPGTTWDYLLRLFDPDYIYSHSPLGARTDAITARYDPLHIEADARLHDANAGPLHGPSNTALRTMIQHWTFQAKSRGQENEETILNNYLLPDAPQQLQLICARERGHLADDEVDALLNATIRGTKIQPFHLNLTESPRFLVPLGLFPHLQQDHHDIFSWNLRGLMTHLIGDSDSIEHPLVIVGNDLTDICLWLTLRTLRQTLYVRDVFWLPSAIMEAALRSPGDAVAVSFLSALYQSLLRSGGDGRTVRTALMSGSLDHETLTEIQRGLTESSDECPPLFVSQDVSSLLPLRHASALEAPEQEHNVFFWHGSSLATLRVEAPPGIGKRTSPDIGFLTDFIVNDFSGPTDPAARPLITTPSRGEHQPVPHRSGRYQAVANIVSGEWQNGLPLAEALLSVRLEFPDGLTLTRRLASSRGFSLTASDAGRTLQEIVGKFGSIRQAALGLTAGPLHLLVDEFANKHPRRNGKLDDLRGNRISLRPDAIAEILHVGADDPTINAALSNWTRRGVIHYGLGLACPQCLARDVYLWEQIDMHGVRCSQCRRAMAVTPDIALGWAPVAVMDEILLKCIRAGGREELSLAHWFDSRPHATRIVFGTEWTISRSKKLEVDVIGVVGGDIWVGEAKSTDTLTDEKIRKLCQFASELQARNLIFATSRPGWSTGTRERLHTAMVEMTEQHTGVGVTVLVGLDAGGATRVENLGV